MSNENVTRDADADIAIFTENLVNMTKGKQRKDWLDMIPGLVKLAAKAEADTGAKRGSKPYNKEFGRIVYDQIRTLSNVITPKDVAAMQHDFSYLLWLAEGDRLTILDEELAKLPIARATRINSPTAMYKLVNKVLKAEEAEKAAAEAAENGEEVPTMPADDKPTPSEKDLVEYIARYLKKFGPNKLALAMINSDLDLSMFKEMTVTFNREYRNKLQYDKDAIERAPEIAMLKAIESGKVTPLKKKRKVTSH